ncbi:hypothetical protein PILCRDRAFT_815124 [Piloderma croceum F 1598]|uniref:Peptidase A1 domain-containing protein n=1 Tax=Piloderma croceum (strain F 1598) TaxID=765440 RepID=A0A0C3BM63_PILCF|nr:hypothetical protein PILCRDRAFT_815124 [Piloderma croceum F 1598]
MQGHLVKESIYRSLESVGRGRRCTAECLPAMYQSQIVASSAYLVVMSIGGQNFSLILDTGSSDLWIVSSECTESDCQGVSKYSKLSSTSLSTTDQPFKLSYLQGTVFGNVAFENITLGEYDISPQVFALVNDTKGLGLSSTGNSGIVGLSFPLPASIPATSGRTLLENVFASLNDYNRFFAYKLGRNQSQDQSQDASFTASSFTVGRLDPAVANNTTGFQYTPVVTLGQTYYDYWKLPLLRITVNSNPLRLSPSLIPGSRTPVAVLDTGTTLILGPSADVINFWSAVGGNGTTRKNLKSGMWEVRCSRAANVSFTLGDTNNPREYVVHPEDINWGEARSSDGWCMGGIQANDAVNSADWLLGDSFLRVRLCISEPVMPTYQLAQNLLAECLRDTPRSYIHPATAYWPSQHD